MRAAAQFEIVGHDHERGIALAIQIEEKVRDLLAGRAVEVAGRFVGEQDDGLVREGARDPDALLFAPGKLGWVVVQPRAEPDALEQSPRRPFRVGCLRSPLRRQQFEGNEHVLERGQRGNQMEVLEDEPDPIGAQRCTLVFVEARERDAGDLDGRRNSADPARRATREASSSRSPKGPRHDDDLPPRARRDRRRRAP